MEQQALIPEVVADAPIDRLGRHNPGLPNGANGRPRGALARERGIFQLMKKVSTSYAVELCEKLIGEALAGDMLAMRIIMARIWPRPRTAPVQIDMPATETPADLRAAMHELLKRVTSGEITTDDGQALVSMMMD